MRDAAGSKQRGYSTKLLMNQNEQSLVQALHPGDRYACHDLVEQFSGKIYNVALKLTGHPAEAEEILQETFISKVLCRGSLTEISFLPLPMWWLKRMPHSTSRAMVYSGRAAILWVVAH